MAQTHSDTAYELDGDYSTYDALPPTDEGWLAWLSLIGAFSSNALIWGFALSFGVMQEFYSTHKPFAGSPAGIPAIGTTATGLMYLTMPMFLAAFQKWPRSRRYALWLSLPTVGVSLVAASFAQTVPQLLVFQGIVYAIGGNALVMPTINYMNEWFVRKRGLAIGVAMAGDGLGGAIMPLILQRLLVQVGFRWALRTVAGIIIVLATPLLFVLRPRLPVSATHIPPPIDTRFLRSPLFWTFQLFNSIQALGYFLPSNYLPTLAGFLGLSSIHGSLTILCVNLGLTIGCVIVGDLVDKYDVTAVVFTISIVSGATVFAILGLATSIAPLYIFSIAYGLTAGAYSTTWGGMIRDIQRKHEGTDANLVFGLMAAGRGFGSIISGPLSEALVQHHHSWNSIDTVYSSQIGSIVVFSGCTAIAGGAAWVMRRAALI